MKAAQLATVATLLPLISSLAQSISVDFNTAGQFGNNFNIYQNPTPGAGSPYQQTPIGGIGNGGAVAVLPPGSTVTADSTAIYKTQSFDFSQTGSTLALSEFVNVIPVTGGANRLLQLGFVNENTSGMNGNVGLAFMSLRLSTVGTSGNTYTPAFQDKTAAGGVVNTTFSNVNLTAGDWYKLSGQFVNLGGGKFQVSGELQDYGVTGQSSPVSVFTFPAQSFSNADVTSDAAVWSAFRTFHNDGANALDNFSAQSVPEPGALALMASGLVSLLCWSRLNRR